MLQRRANRNWAIVLHCAVCLLVLAVTSSSAQQYATRQMQAATANAGPSPARRNASLAEAASLLQSGKLDQAESLLRKIIATAPRETEAHILLGIVLDQRGSTADAEREYRAALRAEPKNVSALANLGVLLAHTD